MAEDDKIRLEDAILDRFAMSAYQTRQWLQDSPEVNAAAGEIGLCGPALAREVFHAMIRLKERGLIRYIGGATWERDYCHALHSVRETAVP